MRFRVWHLLAAMAFVACWLPIAGGLLAIEAQDHPTIPQTAFDVIGFYVGTVPIAFLLCAAGWVMVRRFRKRTSP